MNVVTRQELTARVFLSESGENFISICSYTGKSIPRITVQCMTFVEHAVTVK